mmetsp:Transcript_8921/g.10206  ORF Transcript_8921/g.10206 Transcript_8921/m.10206 type:complete len:271 (-) Transcript_8921:1430-2242(-)
MDLGKELRRAVRENNLGDEAVVFVPLSQDEISRLDVTQYNEKLNEYTEIIKAIISSNQGGFSEVEVNSSGNYDYVSLVSTFEVEGEDFGESTEETRKQGHSFVEKSTGNLFLVDSDPATGHEIPSTRYGIRGNIYKIKGSEHPTFIMKTTGSLRVYQCTVVEVLKTLGADINSVNDFGETALMQAAEMGYVDICAWLVKQEGISLDHQSNSMATAVMKAVQGSSSSHFDVLKLLLDNKANSSVKNKWGVCALDIAKHNNNEKAKAILSAS